MTAEQLIEKLAKLPPKTGIVFGDGRLLILSSKQILPVGHITGPRG